jgi:hypothetical protein
MPDLRLPQLPDRTSAKLTITSPRNCDRRSTTMRKSITRPTARQKPSPTSFLRCLPSSSPAIAASPERA